MPCWGTPTNSDNLPMDLLLITVASFFAG
ncbi:MAG: hypothetical protein RJA56_349, partial [Pseudomonadota bacterium]